MAGIDELEEAYRVTVESWKVELKGMTTYRLNRCMREATAYNFNKDYIQLVREELEFRSRQDQVTEEIKDWLA